MRCYMDCSIGKQYNCIAFKKKLDFEYRKGEAASLCRIGSGRFLLFIVCDKYENFWVYRNDSRIGTVSCMYLGKLYCDRNSSGEYKL